jgi:two-component sensor histidine kinase
VCAQLAHLADFFESRIAVHGPKLSLNEAAAQAVGLALHELATNAAKYGALSTTAGRVQVDWRIDGDAFTMNWTERGGRLCERLTIGALAPRSSTRWLDGRSAVRFSSITPPRDWDGA